MGSQPSRPLEPGNHASSSGQKRSASVMEESDSKSKSNNNNNTNNYGRRPKRQRRPGNNDGSDDATVSASGPEESSRYHYYSSILTESIKLVAFRSARWTVKHIAYVFLKAMEYKCIEHERKYLASEASASSSSSMSHGISSSSNSRTSREDIFGKPNDLEEIIPALLNLLLSFQSDDDTRILSRGWKILAYLLINGRQDRPLPLLTAIEVPAASGGNDGSLEQDIRIHFPLPTTTATTPPSPSLSMINQHLPAREDVAEELFAIVLTVMKESYPSYQNLLHYAGLKAIGVIVGDDVRRGKWLFRAGAVPVLSMVMGMHFDDKKIQFLVVSCLILMMREGATDARRVIARYCRGPLLASMNSGLEFPFVAVYELKKDRDALDFLLDGGIIVAIMSAARKSMDSGDFSTTEKAMRLLTDFATNGVAWRFFESSEIMHLAYTFLDRHRPSAIVVFEILVLIREAGRHDRFPNTLVIKMVEILKKHVSTSSTAFFACAILFEMLEQEEISSSSEEVSVQELILSSGAIDCIIDAARTHKDDPGITPLAYLIMRHIWDNRPQNEAANAATSAFGGRTSVAARITNFRGIFRGGNNGVFDDDDDDDDEEDEEDIAVHEEGGDNHDEIIRDIGINGRY